MSGAALLALAFIALCICVAACFCVLLVCDARVAVANHDVRNALHERQTRDLIANVDTRLQRLDEKESRLTSIESRLAAHESHIAGQQFRRG